MRSFSDKYINEYSKLSILKIGFEFEFYMKNISYYKTLEQLNDYLSPVRVHGFRSYHSDFKPDTKNFKIEPDVSGGSSMVELVTGALPFNEAKYYLIRILKFIQLYGYTNDKCSIHMNYSFNSDKTDYSLNQIDILKTIIRTNEDDIYSKFPSRNGNIYCKSIKNVIPFENIDFSVTEISVIKNNLNLPKDKYYGINFLNAQGNGESRRIEYRYIGGLDYQNKVSDIMEFMCIFGLDLIDNIELEYSESDLESLKKLLNSKMENFKSFSTYDSFLVEYPNCRIQINTDFRYDVVNSYFSKLHKKLYKLFESTIGLTDECIINYHSETDKIEVVNAKFKSVVGIDGFDFINCEISGGVFTNTNFMNSTLIDCDLNSVLLYNADISDSKLVNTKAERSKLDDCLFISGNMNSYMLGGIFRGGKIGEYGELSKTTKVIKEKDNFFGINYGSVDKDSKSYSKMPDVNEIDNTKI